MRKWLTAAILSLISIPAVFAAGVYDAFGPIGDLLLSVMNLITFSWIPDDQQHIAARFFIFVVLLAAINWALDREKLMKGKENRTIRIVIAVAFSAISVIFLPEGLDETIGSQWGMLAAFIGLNLLTALGLIGSYFLIKRLNDGILKSGLWVLWWILGMSTITATSATIGINVYNQTNPNFMENAVATILMIFQLGFLWAIGAGVITFFTGITQDKFKRRGKTALGWLDNGWENFKNIRKTEEEKKELELLNSIKKKSKTDHKRISEMKKTHKEGNTLLSQLNDSISISLRRAITQLNLVTEDIQKIKKVAEDTNKSAETKIKEITKIRDVQHFQNLRTEFIEVVKKVQGEHEKIQNDLKRQLTIFQGHTYDASLDAEEAEFASNIKNNISKLQDQFSRENQVFQRIRDAVKDEGNFIERLESIFNLKSEVHITDDTKEIIKKTEELTVELRTLFEEYAKLYAADFDEEQRTEENVVSVSTALLQKIEKFDEELKQKLGKDYHKLKEISQTEHVFNAYAEMAKALGAIQAIQSEKIIEREAKGEIENLQELSKIYTEFLSETKNKKDVLPAARFIRDEKNDIFKLLKEIYKHFENKNKAIENARKLLPEGEEIPEIFNKYAEEVKQLGQQRQEMIQVFDETNEALKNEDNTLNSSKAQEIQQQVKALNQQIEGTIKSLEKTTQELKKYIPSKDAVYKWNKQKDAIENELRKDYEELATDPTIHEEISEIKQLGDMFNGGRVNINEAHKLFDGARKKIYNRGITSE